MHTTMSIEQMNREQLQLALNHTGLDEALAGLDRFYTADFVRHGDKGDYDKDRLAEGLRRLYTGFPDLRRSQSGFVAEGDSIAYRWEATATHLGEYMGVRPTKRPITTQGMVICRFEGGLIAEEWASWNRASLLYDLGIIPLGRS